MIGLSVAVGRFVEALFWAIFRVAGGVAALVIGGAIALVILALFARRVFGQRRPR